MRSCSFPASRCRGHETRPELRRDDGDDSNKLGDPTPRISHQLTRKNRSPSRRIASSADKDGYLRR